MEELMSKMDYQVINGMIFPATFSPKCLRETFEYKPRNDDVFIVTYPKCGTTWMQNLVFHIFSKGRPMDDPTQFVQYTPFIDMVGEEGVAKMPRPGAIKTHLPYNRMPYSPEAKYIFVARNPTDCCASYYHHIKYLKAMGKFTGDFDDYFELFMAGRVGYNDYFDHLMSWYPHRNDEGVFYTTYEAMKKDLPSIILPVAKFLGQEYSQAIEKDNSVLRNILHYNSFEYMKQFLSPLFDDVKEIDENMPGLFEGVKYTIKYLKTLDMTDRRDESFFRKGVVGDGKHYFTDEKLDRLNQKFLERTRGTEIPQWFAFE